jgi:hypothetical protein
MPSNYFTVHTGISIPLRLAEYASVEKFSTSKKDQMNGRRQEKNLLKENM